MMVGKFRRKVSLPAVWCYRLAIFSIVYFVIAILLHRTSVITTPQLFWLLTAGLIMVCLSLILAIRAYFELWYLDHKGGVLTIRGTIIAFCLLLPFAYYAYKGMTLPLLNDVATNVFDPPEFILVEDERIDGENDGMSQLADYTPEYGETIIRAYPKLATRRYAADNARVFKAVMAVIKSEGWKVRDIVGAPPEEAGNGPELEGGNADPAKKDKPMKQADDQQMAEEDEEDTLIEAVTQSLIIGYKGDVVIRISADEEDTLVDMRSASRWGHHDFGENAHKITDFMTKLDENLLGVAGEETLF